jgi:hypothetical protein
VAAVCWLVLVMGMAQTYGRAVLWLPIEIVPNRGYDGSSVALIAKLAHSCFRGPVKNLPFVDACNGRVFFSLDGLIQLKSLLLVKKNRLLRLTDSPSFHLSNYAFCRCSGQVPKPRGFHSDLPA